MHVDRREFWKTDNEVSDSAKLIHIQSTGIVKINHNWRLSKENHLINYPRRCRPTDMIRGATENQWVL